MADNRLCKINGCGKPARGRGWCFMHYARWRKHGDPAGGRTPNGEAAKYLVDVVLPYRGQDCLIWPYQRDAKGYARIDADGGNKIVSNIVCREVHGNSPPDRPHAAHSCGNGSLGCVSPSHLSWKTPKQNQLDMIKHGRSTRGERQPNARLDWKSVREIRAMSLEISQQKIADLFDVSRATVGLIRQGKTWKE